MLSFTLAGIIALLAKDYMVAVLDLLLVLQTSALRSIKIELESILETIENQGE